MTDDLLKEGGPKPTVTRADYKKALDEFDAAVCEATAASQAIAGRMALPAMGYSTHVFARICSHAQALVCAAPLSRWTRRDFEIWDVSSVASHGRSILEGYLLFGYLADAPPDLDVQRAYVNVIHIYDCQKRIKILPYVLPEEQIKGFEAQAQELRERLESIPYFAGLDDNLKKDLLSGKFMMITPKKDVIASLGINQSEFDFFWNYLSQYTHILSFTFHRMEPNGRGTGVENHFDMVALHLVLSFCTGVLTDATDRLVELFPDAQEVRKGTNSKFLPGPARNLPKHVKRERKREN